MSLTSDQMELREEDITKHYDAALAMLDGFDHSPRIATPMSDTRTEARSSAFRPGAGSARPRRALPPAALPARKACI